MIKELKKKWVGFEVGKNGDNGDRTHDIMQIPGIDSAAKHARYRCAISPEETLLDEIKIWYIYTLASYLRF